MTLYRYLVVDLPIRDTNTHTYRTDPFDPLIPTQPGISLVRLGESVPPVRAFNIYVYNFANAALNVQVIACLLYTSPSPRDGLLSRMPSSA